MTLNSNKSCHLLCHKYWEDILLTDVPSNIWIYVQTYSGFRVALSYTRIIRSKVPLHKVWYFVKAKFLYD